MMKLFEKFDISMKTQLEQLREAQVTHLQLGIRHHERDCIDCIDCCVYQLVGS